MATFVDPNRVQYLASSGIKAPIFKLYFCRHCLKLRSSDCVSHEVDSHYCPNCLENLPSAEAKLKKNRCSSCLNCPSCNHTLAIRATSASFPSVDDPGKVTPKKVFYLNCGFCRWTSRDVNLKDQPTSSGGWPELENPHSKRIGDLLSYYRGLAQQEKVEKEKKKYARRRSYLHLSDKYGLGSVAARRRAGNLSMTALSLKDAEDGKMAEEAVAEPVEDLEPLSDDYYDKPLCLTDVSTLGQRLMNPEFQSDLTKNLYPRHKHFLIKRSQRCRECDHNLSKPEFNPSSIKFKIQLVAVHHVPEIRIMKQPVLQLSKETEVILTLFNPLDTMTHVTLLPTDREDDPWNNAKLELPACEFTMSARDDAAEFDDMGDSSQNFQDDPRVVVFRKANKIGFFIRVTPETENEDVKISFRMKYDYKNMALAVQSEKKEPETVLLSQYVYLSLGSLNQ